MSLADDYKRQLAWRSWTPILEALPRLEDKWILDLGCGVGDQAALLAARGAHVIGVDGNEELLTEARSKDIPNADFRHGDLRALDRFEAPMDGLWSSFTAAYFPADLPEVLSSWKAHLRPGAWIALTEIDNFFAHEPLSAHTRSLLEAYTDDALASARYDFRMGRRLARHAKQAGLTVVRSFTVEDQEFSAQGPVQEGVVDAWCRRLDRMTLLQDFCGSDFARVRRDFRECLEHPDHATECRVHVCLATN